MYHKGRYIGIFKWSALAVLFFCVGDVAEAGLLFWLLLIWRYLYEIFCSVQKAISPSHSFQGSFIGVVWFSCILQLKSLGGIGQLMITGLKRYLSDNIYWMVTFFFVCVCFWLFYWSQIFNLSDMSSGLQMESTFPFFFFFHHTLGIRWCISNETAYPAFAVCALLLDLPFPPLFSWLTLGQ